MSVQQSSYRRIFNATSLFGGVQVYQVLLTIVRSKFVAVLLGAQGMGITGLLLSVTGLISGVTGMGISVSAIRNISEASQSGDEVRISRVVAVVKRLALITGTIGMVATILLSPLLSRITFGNYSYTLSFIALSVTFLLGSLASSHSVLMQGLRKLNHMAKANVLGATAGLIVSLPFYYLYGVDGIVPAIILSALLAAFFAYFFGSKLDLQRSMPVSLMDVWREGKDMMTVGIMLSLSGIVASASAYALRLFINLEGSLADVGLYSAGFAIVNTYVGMIFTAMGTDYYPRLSAVVHDRTATNVLVNQQAEVALLILGPILILFLIVLEFAVAILYTKEFLATIDMVQWAVLAIYFKALTWSMGFIYISKGDGKVFFWTEVFASTHSLILSMLGYFYFGLEGLGLAFLLSYIVSVCQNAALTYYRYKYIASVAVYKLLFIYLLISFPCLLLMRQNDQSIIYLFSAGLLIVASWYSLRQLNKRIDFVSYGSEFMAGWRGK